MANLTALSSIVAELKGERANLINQLRHVDAALSVLGKLNGGSSSAAPKQHVSAAARRKMSLAQKARWARRAAANGKVTAPSPKRGMSAAVRRKIAAAQRARWAKVKASQKA